MSALRQKMSQDLQLAGLSAHTHNQYLRAVRKLAEYYRICPSQLTEKQIRDYFLYLKNDKKYAAGTLRVAWGGIKFFYTHTVLRDWRTLKTLRIGRQRRLPEVLSVEAVRQLFATVRTLHHRVYLWTVYSCGLRLSEALNLQVGDIDSQRRTLRVRLGKGGKDRVVPLPQATLRMLREFWATHRNPRWLFPKLGRGRRPSAKADQPMAKGGVQACLRAAVEQLGWKRRIRVHTLRHSYATHLLDQGVNLRFIQQYLGHRSIQTTALYLHLTTRGQEHARGLIDSLMTEVCDADRR